MNEKEELEWLRREKDRDMRFKESAHRGLLLGFLVGVFYTWLVPLDTVETRVALLPVVLIAFATGALTAYVGRFRIRRLARARCEIKLHVSSEGELKKRIRLKWIPHGISIREMEEILDAAKDELVNLIKEIEKNATEDTIFERMVLYRLMDYADKWHGTHLNEESLKKCAENREKFAEQMGRQHE